MKYDLDGDNWNKEECLKQVVETVEDAKYPVNIDEMKASMALGFNINTETANEWLSTLIDAGKLKLNKKGRLIPSGEKPDFLTTKLEILEKINQLDQPFVSRELHEKLDQSYKGYTNRWVQRLHQQGYLNKLDADRDDKRIKHSYKLNQQAKNYLEYRKQ